MPRSMTGFARVERQESWGTIACEIRAVNHRYLEPTLRLPESLRGIENDFRTLLKSKLSRGKVEANVHIKIENQADGDMALNFQLAHQVQSLVEQVSANMHNPAPINPLEILRWPGVLQTAEIDKDVLEKAALENFAAALQKLVENREREGEQLKTFVTQRLDDIDANIQTVRERLPEILATHQAKLREKLAALEVDVDPDRLAQELVILAQKSDVAEEIDRLSAHLTEVKRTLSQQQPIGRRLDFLMQELNREANTLSSKSIASDTTQSAVDLKVLIEQMREQIQNIE